MRFPVSPEQRPGEAFFKTVDALPQHIALLDRRGVIVAVNKSWRAFARANHGREAAVGVGVDYLSACRMAARAGDPFAMRALSGLDALLSGATTEAFVMEYPCHASERPRWFVMHAAPADFGGGEILVSHSDISDAKQVQQALIESEERLRFALETSQTGAWDLDLATGAAQRSLEHDRVFGYDHLLPAWTYEMFLAHVAPEDRDDVDAKFKHAVATRSDWSFECRIIRADGATRWIWAAGRHRGANRLAGIVQDITDRKAVEEALKQADRRKDEFLAVLAHELRNPLAPIRNGLEVLRRSGGGGPAAERMHEIMGRQIAHLIRLVDDLLEVSRITTGKIALQKERVDLASIIERAVEICSHALETNRLELNLQLATEPLTLDGDPVRLVQVFANLLNNAAKYTPPGGRVELVARRRGDMAVVTVRDTGIGISAHLLPRIFDLFTQAQSAHGGLHDGLGIGLALVRNLVELHGGAVAAESAGEGRGSVFTVTLPMANATPPHTP